MYALVSFCPQSSYLPLLPITPYDSYLIARFRGCQLTWPELTEQFGIWELVYSFWVSLRA